MFVEQRAQPGKLCLVQAFMFHQVNQQAIARAAKELGVSAATAPRRAGARVTRAA